MLRVASILLIAYSVIQTGCRCDQDKGAAAGQPSASASVPEVQAQRPRQAASSTTHDRGERLLLPRRALGKEPPPLKPPADAVPAALGVFYRQLTRGKERTPAPKERLFAELKAWDATGKVLTDTSGRPEPLMFGQQSLPEPLRLELAEQPIGSAFQLWLPSEATQGWKFVEWPSEGIVRLELHIIGAAAPTATLSALGTRAEGIPKAKPPESTGPPANAKRGPEGLRYVWLASGPEGSHPAATSHVSLRVTGYEVEGVVVSEIVRDQKTEMDLAKAPKAIAHVVSKMVRGDSVRAWLGPALARDVFPRAKSDVVVDVTLVAID